MLAMFRHRVALCFCSRLQASAVAFGESLAIPEIVAIGGQVRAVLLRLATSTPQYCLI